MYVDLKQCLYFDCICVIVMQQCEIHGFASKPIFECVTICPAIFLRATILGVLFCHRRLSKIIDSSRGASRVFAAKDVDKSSFL